MLTLIQLRGEKFKIMTKIYLAHNYEAQEYLKINVRPLLESNGFKITSNWLDCKDSSNKGNRRQNAKTDIRDIDNADVFLYFSESFAGKSGKGKWVEFGFAVAQDKEIYIIGDDKGSIFLTLAHGCFETVKDFIKVYKNDIS